ncbi:MAG: hypothetical protein KDI15_11460 [Thiothrix sp.]|nr:hypothetical protein [Thiothrix sp.]HPE58954.1 hypothetical protein [Thiolinea sp.]
MKAIVVLAFGLLLSTTVLAAQPDPENGRKLFSESRCLSCHGIDVFTRIDRKVKNIQQLESRVRSCDANLSTNWFDDQILDVVAYLNQMFYKFDTPVTRSTVRPDAGSTNLSTTDDILQPPVK